MANLSWDLKGQARTRTGLDPKLDEARRRPAVLVAGSGGFLGSALCGRLAATYRVIGLDARPPERLMPGVEHLDVDLGSEGEVAGALVEVRRRTEGTLAGVAHLEGGGPGFRALLRALQDFHCGPFVLAGTMRVHAPCQPGQRIDERWALRPLGDPKTPPAAARALALEGALRAGRGRLPALVLRLAWIYDDHCRLAPLARQIQRIHERRVLGHVFPGDLSHGQACVHLEDALEAFARALDRRAVLPEESAVLVGEPRTLGYGELQKRLAELLHGPGAAESWSTLEVPRALARAGGWEADLGEGEAGFEAADAHYALDAERARLLLGWRPHRDLESTLPHMVEALRRDPAAWYREHGLEGLPTRVE